MTGTSGPRPALQPSMVVGKGWSIASLVLGVSSVVLSFSEILGILSVILGILCGITASILGAVSLRRSKGSAKGRLMPITGIVLGIVGFVASTVFAINYLSIYLFWTNFRMGSM